MTHDYSYARGVQIARRRWQEEGGAFHYAMVLPGIAKVGVSVNLKGRAAAISTEARQRVTVHHSIWVPLEHLQAVESYTHWLLRADHLRGEWFAVEPDQAVAAMDASVAAARDGLPMEQFRFFNRRSGPWPATPENIAAWKAQEGHLDFAEALR